jgi:hypothetical protein
MVLSFNPLILPEIKKSPPAEDCAKDKTGASNKANNNFFILF